MTPDQAATETAAVLADLADYGAHLWLDEDGFLCLYEPERDVTPELEARFLAVIDHISAVVAAEDHLRAHSDTTNKETDQ